MANTVITLTIPSAIATRVLDAICGQNNYQDEIEIDGALGPNPESKKDFAKRMVIKIVKNWVKTWEVNQAVSEARSLAIDAADTEINIS